MRPIFPSVAPMALLALLAGCTVGPDYSGPPAAAPVAAGAGAFVRAGDAPVASAPPLARWWEALGDPALNGLETRALAANPDLAAAEARIRQAREDVRQQRANLLPSGNGSAVYAHAHFPGVDLTGSDSGGDSTSDLNLYNVGFDASWEMDLFGGQRRAVEAARASAGQADANLADTQVSITAEVAQAYVNARDRQRRIALDRRAIALQERMLALTRERYARGTASRLDVERLSRQIDGARADETPLHAELEAYWDELATLTGQEPGAVDAAMAAGAELPLPPAAVAVGDPAALLQRRPDIRAAERALAADTARIGQAKAARFPRVTFMGIVGIGGASLSDLTHLDDYTALLAPQLSWNFLDFGRNAAKVRQAEGVRDEAEAQYRGTVLAALRDAEDSLSRFRYGRQTVATLARARQAADESARLARQRYDAGTGTLIDLLDAQRQQAEAERSLSTAEAGLTGDFIAVQKALGLGWGPAA